MLNRNIVSSSRQAPHRTFRAPLSRHARCTKRNAVPGTSPGPPVQWDKAEDPDNAQPGYGYVPADTAPRGNLLLPLRPPRLYILRHRRQGQHHPDRCLPALR